MSNHCGGLLPYRGASEVAAASSSSLAVPVGASLASLDLANVATSNGPGSGALAHLDLAASGELLKRAVAVVHNETDSGFLALPREIRRQILGELPSERDLAAACCVCRQLEGEAGQEKQQRLAKTIQSFIGAATIWDKELRELSDSQEGLLAQPLVQTGSQLYRRFQFNPAPYQAELQDLKSACLRQDEILTRMRLDLVEALAEHMPSGLLDQLSVPNNPACAEVLAQAKFTLKGDVFLTRTSALCEINLFDEASAMYNNTCSLRPPPGAIVHEAGPYLFVHYTSHYNCDWNYGDYIVAQDYGVRQSYAHIDLFMGKREGDRIVIPREDGRQIMLRLNQLRYGYSWLGPFETALRNKFGCNPNWSLHRGYEAHTEHYTAVWDETRERLRLAYDLATDPCTS